MTVKRVFAVVAVSDLQGAEAWYADLFGAGPDARPMDGLLEWYFGAAGDLQLGEGFRTVQDPDGNAITLVGA